MNDDLQKIDEKLNKLIDLVKQLKELFPSNGLSVMVHDINIKDLDENIWEVEAQWQSEIKDVFLTAKLKDENIYNNLTIFE